ncbi:MAG: hypothetical protein M0Q29_09765 [Thiopseudomonas sp.]|jgi:hypothetical protein|nr:hypothetical protein [Thiopseudomonas sp.]MDY0413929.1 hypothetical protein [Pseudomonas sp.]
MSDKVEHCQIDEFTDDSLAYDKAQAGVQTDDPLAAIKNMRLEQLAVCRLKTEEEMQAMRDASVRSAGQATDQ